MKAMLGMAGIFICIAALVHFFQTARVSSPLLPVHPTLVIHGFRGTERSMATMIERFESNGWGSHVKTCVVKETGQIQCRNVRNAKQGSIPLIHVVFQNNTANLQQQGEWVSKVARKIGEEYETEKINIIGHSMGGLAALKYLTGYHSPSYPTVEKLVTVGTPVAGLRMEDLVKQYPMAKKDVHTPAAIDLHIESDALNDLHQQLRRLNQYDTSIFSIAGNVQEMGKTRGDGSVTVESALYLRTFSEKVKTASFSASHFDLHESAGVDCAVYEFIREDKGNFHQCGMDRRLTTRRPVVTS
ncbi:alpha/beta hydrolase [Bacillus songklensis]